MLRIRIHGRGGHGTKTASRILGTAAFISGFQASDSPVYGAERRGAAVVAFTRIDHEPIRERGVIPDPDLILVADESLLADPAAGVLRGSEFASAVFVNSPQPASPLAARYRLHGPVRTLDLTAMAADILGRGNTLSAPLGAVGCALSGVVTPEVLACAVTDELTALGLDRGIIEKNVELARRVFALIRPAPSRPRLAPANGGRPFSPVHVAGVGGVPVILAPANSPARHTGSWRISRPIIDRAACTRCRVCLSRCPDAAIRLDAEGYPLIDYDGCKGCLICVEECPVRCIHEEREVRAW